MHEWAVQSCQAASMDYESLTVHRGRTAPAVSWRPLATRGEATTCRPLGAAAVLQRPCVSTNAPSSPGAKYLMAETRVATCKARPTLQGCLKSIPCSAVLRWPAFLVRTIL